MIRIYDTPSELSQHLAQFFVEICLQSVNDRGRFTVSLTGGSSPKELYELLAAEPFAGQIPWDKVFIFWGDERCVPDNDPQNNARMTTEALLDHVPVPAGNVFRMQGSLPAGEAAEAYEEILHRFFAPGEPAFDLILLGMGDNAHTASLFPHTQVLTEKTAWVKGLYIDEVKMDRITLTAPLINRSLNIAFIVFGAGKAQTLHDVLEGDYDIQAKPVQLISPDYGKLYWFIDKAAAGRLSAGSIAAN